MSWFDNKLSREDYEAFFACEARRMEADLAAMEDAVRTAKMLLAVMTGKGAGQLAAGSPADAQRAVLG